MTMDQMAACDTKVFFIFTNSKHILWLLMAACSIGKLTDRVVHIKIELKRVNIVLMFIW